MHDLFQILCSCSIIFLRFARFLFSLVYIFPYALLFIIFCIMQFSQLFLYLFASLLMPLRLLAILFASCFCICRVLFFALFIVFVDFSAFPWPYSSNVLFECRCLLCLLVCPECMVLAHPVLFDLLCVMFYMRRCYSFCRFWAFLSHYAHSHSSFSSLYHSSPLLFSADSLGLCGIPLILRQFFSSHVSGFPYLPLHFPPWRICFAFFCSCPQYEDPAFFCRCARFPPLQNLDALLLLVFFSPRSSLFIAHTSQFLLVQAYIFFMVYQVVSSEFFAFVRESLVLRYDPTFFVPF